MEKIFFALLFILLPLVINLLEQKKRRERADKSMKEVQRRQNERRGAPPPPPRSEPQPGSSLADWIEDIRRKNEEAAMGIPDEGPRRSAQAPSVPVFLDEEDDELEDFASVAGQETAQEDFRDENDEHPQSRYATRKRDVKAVVVVEPSRKRQRRREEFPELFGSASKLKKAMILREVLSPPLSLRED